LDEASGIHPEWVLKVLKVLKVLRVVMGYGVEAKF
jgi:hypothetical protein